MATSVVESAWNDQSSWSQAADRLKRGLERWWRLALTLAVLGAVLSASTIAVGLDSAIGKMLAFMSAAAVGLAGIVRGRTSANAVQSWTRARSVSEAIKSEVFTHLACRGAEDTLDERVTEMERDASDLLRYKAAAVPRRRPLPEVHDVESYLSVRVRGQIHGYYRRRAHDLDRKAVLVRRVELALGIAGAVLAAAAGTWETEALVIWVPVGTTVAGAVSAHAAAARYEYLTIEYLRTASELERLASRRGTAAGLSDDDLVATAERVISIQNEGWMAKLASGDTDS